MLNSAGVDNEHNGQGHWSASKSDFSNSPERHSRPSLLYFCGSFAVRVLNIRYNDLYVFWR